MPSKPICRRKPFATLSGKTKPKQCSSTCPSQSACRQCDHVVCDGYLLSTVCLRICTETLKSCADASAPGPSCLVQSKSRCINFHLSFRQNHRLLLSTSQASCVHSSAEEGSGPCRKPLEKLHALRNSACKERVDNAAVNHKACARPGPPVSSHYSTPKLFQEKLQLSVFTPRKSRNSQPNYFKKRLSVWSAFDPLNANTSSNGHIGRCQWHLKPALLSFILLSNDRESSKIQFEP